MTDFPGSRPGGPKAVQRLTESLNRPGAAVVQPNFGSRLPDL